MDPHAASDRDWTPLAIGRPRILVVDDRPANLTIMAELLGDLGHVVLAQSGQDALRHLLRQEFAVVLLDVQMPDMDGYELAQLIRSRKRTRHLPIIFVTAFGSEQENVSRGYALGAVDYVFKPVEPLALQSKVAVFVDLFRKTEEVRRQADFERLLFREALQAREEKSRAEQALRVIEERQALIVRSLPVALYTVRLGGSFTGPRFVSEQIADRTGYAAAQFVTDEALWPSRIHPDDAEPVTAALARIEATGSLSTEYRWQCADGSERHFLDHAMLIRDEDGYPKEIVGTCLDVTDRKQVERQLVQAQKMEAVGQLSGGIAHDFNNMLLVVISNLDMLHRSLKERADAAAPEAGKKPGRDVERVEMALKGAQSCADLTRRLLAFSRRQPLRPEVVDLRRLVPDTLSMLRPALGPGVEIVLDIAEGAWPAFADATQIETALLNLAINARDAMPAGGTLTIEVGNAHLSQLYVEQSPDAVAGDFVMLAVTDTGHGMPSEVAARAFEPFFTTKAQQRGTGLGLSMIYGFAKQSGGHVKIESVVDQGTTVRIYLPRTHRAPAAADLVEEFRQPIAQGETVLVVDDDADVRAIVTAQFRELGFAVLEASTASAALGLIEGPDPIDLLFTDIVMPGGMDGFDLAREAHARRPDLRILYTSGYATEFQNAEPGYGELLPKPYRQKDLIRVLSRAASEPAEA